MIRSNEPRIVIVKDGEEYTGDQVALRFIEAEIKNAKITAGVGSAGLQMIWTVSICAVHIPEKYKGISFAAIFQRGVNSSKISPNLVTEGDTITMELSTSGQIDINLIDKTSTPGSVLAELLAGIGPV
jgi:hypothetical protein